MNKPSAMSAIFDPPLSTQRYCWVQNFLTQDPSVKTVTDVGCGHGRMAIWLKHVSSLETINCIDRCLTTIEDGIDMNIQPNLHDMLFGRQDTDQKLNLNVYHGDIVVPDDRLRADCFTMVELIEHLPLDQVERMCQTVFGYYNPRFVIVTTPNREFNPLLSAYTKEKQAKLTTKIVVHSDQKVQGDESIILNELEEKEKAESDSSQSSSEQSITVEAKRFRHHDHKFEWNRAEFGHWANYICKTYLYDVFISGVGHLPGSEPYGPCTQIALFKRQDRPTTSTGLLATDPTLCFDLLLNKLSVEEERFEFLGDPSLRTICLRSSFCIPGKPVTKSLDEFSYTSWDDGTSEEPMDE